MTETDETQRPPEPDAEPADSRTESPADSLTESPAESLEARVSAHKGTLVALGNDLGRKAAGNEGWKSQIRIILEAAREETEPAVLRNLIRYQSVRNASWSQKHKILPDLDSALDRVTAEAGDDRELTMELIRHLLVYTLRAYTYEAKAGSETGDEAGTEAGTGDGDGGGSDG